jgi:hypothetical protein
MSRSAARARAGGDRTSLYQQITDKIIAELETGRVPWVRPWGTLAAKASLSMPKNAATQRHYSGINVLTLWGAVIERGFAGQAWVTFHQALGLGGHVPKGERGTTVVYADRFISDDERRRAEETGEEPEAAPGDYDDYYIASILRSEDTTFRLDQGILFTTCDALGHDALEKAISRTRQIDRWLASDFDEAIMFDEADAVQHAAGEESECRAHDNLNTIPQAASVGDKAAA